MIYYNARYYVVGIGRFASADTIVPDPMNPQSLNRYTYVLNSPLNYTDPSGNCEFEASWDGSSIRDSSDGDCWNKYDQLSQLMENNTRRAEKYGFDEVEARDWDEDKLDGLLHFYTKRINNYDKDLYSPLQNWDRMVDRFFDEILPDAAIAGVSGNAAGIIAGVAGVEEVYNFDDKESSSFSYVGQGGGVALKANVTGYGGFVWNLEDNIDYEGAFTTLTADLSFIEGVQANFFWSTDSIPFTGDTWGFSIGYSKGGGAGVTGTQTDFTCQRNC